MAKRAIGKILLDEYGKTVSRRAVCASQNLGGDTVVRYVSVPVHALHRAIFSENVRVVAYTGQSGIQMAYARINNRKIHQINRKNIREKLRDVYGSEFGLGEKKKHATCEDSRILSACLVFCSGISAFGIPEKRKDENGLVCRRQYLRIYPSVFSL